MICQINFKIFTGSHQPAQIGGVTICTIQREHHLGEIIFENHGSIPPIMQLSEIGKLAENYWWSITEHFPFVKLEAFVVMPNHIHGILVIDKPDSNAKSNYDIHVETGQCPVSTTKPFKDPITYSEAELKTPGQMRYRNQGKDTVSSIIEFLLYSPTPPYKNLQD